MSLLYLMVLIEKHKGKCNQCSYIYNVLIFEEYIHFFPPIKQVALVDLLSAIGVMPDGILGHSVGELACGYADGSLTAKETILAAFWRGKCIQEANLPLGGMAAVGKKFNLVSNHL